MAIAAELRLIVIDQLAKFRDNRKAAASIDKIEWDRRRRLRALNVSMTILDFVLESAAAEVAHHVKQPFQVRYHG